MKCPKYSGDLVSNIKHTFTKSIKEEEEVANAIYYFVFFYFSSASIRETGIIDKMMVSSSLRSPGSLLDKLRRILFVCPLTK